MLVVLVGLYGYTGQRAVAGDIIGLAQEAVAGRESALEEAYDIYLAACRRKGIEVEIMDMDIAVTVCAALLGCQDILFIEILCALAAVLEHRAHGGVAVDIGVVALEVTVLGIGKGDLVIYAHEVALHLASLIALGAVDYILFGYHGISVVHQDKLYDILYILNAGGLIAELLDQLLLDQLCHPLALAVILARAGLHGLGDGRRDLIYIVRRLPAVALYYRFEHFDRSLYSLYFNYYFEPIKHRRASISSAAITVNNYNRPRVACQRTYSTYWACPESSFVKSNNILKRKRRPPHSVFLFLLVIKMPDFGF